LFLHLGHIYDWFSESMFMLILFPFFKHFLQNILLFEVLGIYKMLTMYF
jgi:hypothetical protein